MRRIVYWAMSTLSVLVLLLSYPTSRNATAPSAESRPLAASTAPSASGSARTGSGTSSGTGSGTSSGGSGASSRAVTGDAVMTRYGNVQVKITVVNGKITAADVTQVPSQDRRDQMINSQAVPIYNSEAVQAQSAQIDVVSGATYTWQGYTQSLQSAIDQAHL